MNDGQKLIRLAEMLADLDEMRADTEGVLKYLLDRGRFTLHEAMEEVQGRIKASKEQ